MQEQLGLTVHPGSKTALALQGAAHSIPMGAERIVLFARQGERLPKWFGTYQWNARIEVVKTDIFMDGPGTGMAKLDMGEFSMAVSSRERALFEFLYRLPADSDAGEALHLMENLATLQPAVVQRLLETCSSVKTKRLFMVLARSADHTWLRKVDASKVDFGKGKRVFARHGFLDREYHITVPHAWKPGGQIESHNVLNNLDRTLPGNMMAKSILKEDNNPMKTHSEIQAILHAHAEELRKKYGLVNMAVFGSVVRGEAREGSDVDILTGFERPISLLTLVDAEYFLGDLLGVKVDLVPARSVRPELKERILGEAVPV
jgi:predicted nucleotidyltransferase